MSKNRPDIHIPRFLIKGLLILILLGLNYLTLTFFSATVAEDISYDDESYRDSHLQELTAEDDYSRLYDYLVLYDLYDEKYEDFWDVTEAWHLYCRYLAAREAAENLEFARDAGKSQTADSTQAADDTQIAGDTLTADGIPRMTADDYRRQADAFSARLREFPADQENRTAREAVGRILERVS